MILDRTLMWLTWRQLFAKRRWMLAIVFALVPALISLLYRLNVGGAEPLRFLTGLNKEITLGTLLPLAAVLFGTNAFGGDVDDGTLVYLLVKPLPRWRVVLSKYVVAVVSTLVVIVTGIVLSWALLRSPELPPNMVSSFATGALVGSVLYCALFVAMGIATKRALVVGLFYVIALEAVLSRNLDGVRSFSIREFVVTTAERMSDSTLMLQAIVTPTTAWTMGTLIFVGGLVFAMWKLNRYEMAEQM